MTVLATSSMSGVRAFTPDEANPAGKARGGGRTNQGPPDHAVANGYRQKLEPEPDPAPESPSLEDPESTIGEEADLADAAHSAKRFDAFA